MNDRRIVALPSTGGGLDGERSAHFGHAPAFTLVTLEAGAVTEVRDLANPPHEHGGCGATVRLLADAGVTDVVVAGIGGGPLGGLLAAGIDTYHDTERMVVRDALAAFLAGSLPKMSVQQACRGHGH